MNIRSMLPSLTRFVALLFFLAPAGILAAQEADSAEISRLFSEVKIHAAQADYDADMLETFTRNKLHWTSHTSQIAEIKEHVNDLIQDSNQLKALRPQGSPWQQQTIDRIHEPLSEISTQLSAMIKYLQENQSKINMPEYQAHVRTNYKLINDAHKVIDDSVDNGQTKSNTTALVRDSQQDKPSNQKQ